MSEVKAEMGFAEFARHLGVRPSYITELRKTGRLVLTDDAKAVKVAESVALISKTRDPSWIGVSARHAAERGNKLHLDTAAPASEVAAQEVLVSAREQPTEAAAASDEPIRDERLVRERNPDALDDQDLIRKKCKGIDLDNAKKALELKIAMGKVAPVADIEAAAADLVTALRRRLEGMGTTLAPLVAPVSEPSACKALIDEFVEGVLRETSDTLKPKKETLQ